METYRHKMPSKWVYLMAILLFSAQGLSQLRAMDPNEERKIVFTSTDNINFLVEDIKLSIRNNDYKNIHKSFDALFKDYYYFEYQNKLLIHWMIDFINSQNKEFKENWASHYILEIDNFLKGYAHDPCIIVKAVFSERKKKVIQRLILLLIESGDSEELYVTFKLLKEINPDSFEKYKKHSEKLILIGQGKHKLYAFIKRIFPYEIKETSLSGILNFDFDYLNLSGKTIELNDLASLKFCYSLKSLILPTSITDDKLLALSNISLKRLKHLNLIGSQITGYSLKLLTNCPNLGELNLYGSDINDKGLAGLKNIDLNNLKSLDLRNTNIHELPFQKLRSLKTLRLANTYINDNALESMSKCNLENLETLDLSGSQVTDNCIKHLKVLKKLKTLDFSNTAMSNKGINQLINFSLPQLKKIKIMNSKCDPDFIKAIQKKYGAQK